MAYRFFSRIPFRNKLLAGAIPLGGAAAGVAGSQGSRDPDNDPILKTQAEIEFATSSLHPVPAGWHGRVWSIRNDYPPFPALGKVASSSPDMPVLPGPTLPPPSGDPLSDAPWLKVDFKEHPREYCRIIKEYCLEGNVNNNFVLQNNQVRQWYHAPWMHRSPVGHGREPLNGFTFELPTPPGVLAKSQKRYIQNWACGFYNSAGAAIFGNIWRNPNSPQWDKDVNFPLGTCVFKILVTEAKIDEIPTLLGAPVMKGVIAPPGKTPADIPNPMTRNTFATDLHLLQMDFAVRDDRAPIGWIFGTFIYDGMKQELEPWDRLIPVGLMWGNSPELTQAAYESGKLPTEQWLNKDAETLMAVLRGSKPFPGWNKRLNGPVDSFVSACASCHSLSQKSGESSLIFKPQPPKGSLVPPDDKKTMQWFRNIPSGKPFTEGAISGDYSLQLMTGWHNYQSWLLPQQGLASRLIRGAKVVFKGSAQMPGSKEKTSGRSQQYKE